MYCKTRNQTVNLTSIQVGDYLLIEEWGVPVTIETASIKQSKTRRVRVTEVAPRYIRADWTFMRHVAEMGTPKPENHFVAKIIRKL